MAVKNAVSKSWQRTVAWDNRRYSDPARIPPVGGSDGIAIIDGELILTRAAGGFGVRPTAQPIAYDNFEAGVLGAEVSGAPLLRADSNFVWTTQGSGPERHKFSSAQTRGVGTKSSRAHFLPNDGGFNVTLQVEHAIPNQGDAVYFSFWAYFERLSVTKSRNFKPWHCYGNNDSVPAAYIGVGSPTFGDGSMRTARQDTPLPNNGDSMYGGPDADEMNGEWWRFEQYFVQSSPNQPDGIWQSWATRGDGSAPTQLHAEDLTSIMRTTNNYHRGWAFGEYHDRIDTYPNPTASDAEAAVYFDEIYFDRTRMRVELGNAPTWAACTQRELQPSIAWADNQVRCIYNQGLLQPGTTAYAYVVDANGIAQPTNYSRVI